jgi:hypothetical protein
VLLPWHRYEVGSLIPGFQGDVEYALMWTGRSVSEVHDIRPAGEIVEISCARLNRPSSPPSARRERRAEAARDPEGSLAAAVPMTMRRR